MNSEVWIFTATRVLSPCWPDFKLIAGRKSTADARSPDPSAIEKGFAVCGRVRIVLRRRPTGELFVVVCNPGARFDFETDHPFGPRQDRVPHARRNIDAPEVAFRGFFAESVASRNCTMLIEENHIRHAFQNQKGFGFWRDEVAMRSYIGTMQKDVQKTVWIVGCVGMKVVIHPEARRRGGKCRNHVNQGTRDQFHFKHCFRLPWPFALPSLSA